MFNSASIWCIAAAGLAHPGIVSGQLAVLLKANSLSPLVQNRYADREDLSRMRDVGMIRRFHRSGYLVRVPVSTRHYYLRFVPPQYRYLRPWSKLFLDRLSRQYYARFKKRLRVTSLVRTVALQHALSKRNENAASPIGERRSSHLTGATLDISKRWMTPGELEWMRRVIHSLRKQGYLYGIEEFSQPAFHIMVFRDYHQYVKARTKRVFAKR